MLHFLVCPGFLFYCRSTLLSQRLCILLFCTLLDVPNCVILWCMMSLPALTLNVSNDCRILPADVKYAYVAFLRSQNFRCPFDANVTQLQVHKRFRQNFNATGIPHRTRTVGMSKTSHLNDLKLQRKRDSVRRNESENAELFQGRQMIEDDVRAQWVGSYRVVPKYYVQAFI